MAGYDAPIPFEMPAPGQGAAPDLVVVNGRLVSRRRLIEEAQASLGTRTGLDQEAAAQNQIQQARMARGLAPFGDQPPPVASVPGPAGYAPLATATTTDRTSNYSQRTTKLSKDEIKAQEATEQVARDQEANLVRQGEHQRALAEIENQQAQETVAKNAEFEADRQARDNAAAAKLSEATAQRDSAVEEYKNKGIQSFWRDKTEGQRALATIGIALGEFGSKLAGGPNGAATILENAIDRDFEGQRQDIAKAREMIELRGLTVNSAEAARRLSFEDWHARKEAAFGAMADKYAAAKAARGATAVDIANDSNIQALRMRQAQERQKWNEAKRTEVTQGSTQHTETGPGAASKQQEKLQALTIYDSAGKPIGLAPDETSARSIRVAQGGAGDMLAMLAALKESNAKHGATLLPTSQAYQEREALASNIVTAAKNLYQLGVLSDSDMNLVAAQAGTWAERRAGTASAKIDTTMNLVKQKADRFLKLNGIQAPAAEAAPAGRQPPSAAPASAGPSVTEAMEWVRKNPNDPDAPKWRAWAAKEMSRGRGI